MYNVTCHTKIFQSNDNIKQLEVTIYDHHPSLNPDFEYPLSHGEITRGLVSKTLVNGLPAFVGRPLEGAINNASTFNSWFVNTPGINIPINTKLTLTRSNTDESRYILMDDYFFPIDNKGWDEIKLPNGSYQYLRYTDQWSKISWDPQQAYNGQYHNFHFCLHASASFDYKGNEVFTFKGDDDVWVYVNGQLIVDLGGIHQMENASVDFSTLGIKKGDRCKFDFFYCERHTDRSEIEIETELEFYCAYKDYCGACQGTGTSCCDAPRDCDDGNPCTLDLCPTDYSNDALKHDNWRNHCIHKAIDCTPSNKCEMASCSHSTNGTCQRSPLVCRSIPCKIAECNKDFGCQYKDKVCGSSDQCTQNKCSNDSCIEVKTDCNDNNPCTADSCDPIVGCTHIKKDCDDNNPCTSDSCGSDGKCVNSAIANCTACACPAATKCDTFICNANGSCEVTPKLVSDGNACTIDKCDPKTGEMTFTPNKCNNTDPCQNYVCNRLTGECVGVQMNCDDSNECTADGCLSGSCVHAPKLCDDQDACTIDSCSSTNGTCIHTPMVCPQVDICNIGYCHHGKCMTKPVECKQPKSFCKIGVCDSQAGCIEIPRACIPDDSKCQKGWCDEEKQKCEYRSYDPLPFACQSIAVKAGVAIGAAAIAGIVIGGAAAIALAAFGGKKGYDYWKNQQTQKMSVSNQNPLYEEAPTGGVNPLYGDS
ncbi:hypothetical protein PPL_04793 [Heterostelium album PN500]|uniref:PA14 domain-containing protein n=1 Tax=Heterostelium pallidum (strain ATCC 26659 / Pp 5 / PN500) TaxID=670386 RepID=D3B8K0_HETP5|nr:hypothetical protein PPL_04793 [Heterostelium album PN500]EFA82368.1 hypothetical protein PPL_04793 [Heterostelium album PN500]|eukprot:XP_020434485.1 hypothetical protein PPL_04793 [Heterostelium album PN500]